jgi:hypothetical protein
MPSTVVLPPKWVLLKTHDAVNSPCLASPCVAVPFLAPHCPARPRPSWPCTVGVATRASDSMNHLPAGFSSSLPCLALPCHALPGSALLRPARPGPALPVLARPRLATLVFPPEGSLLPITYRLRTALAMPSRAQPRRAMPCPACPCRAEPCPAKPIPALLWLTHTRWVSL